MIIHNEKSVRETVDFKEIADNACKFGFGQFEHVNIPLTKYNGALSEGVALIYRVVDTVYYLGPEVTVTRKNEGTVAYVYTYSLTWNLYRIVYSRESPNPEVIIIWTGKLKTFKDLQKATGRKFRADLKTRTMLYKERANKELKKVDEILVSIKNAKLEII